MPTYEITTILPFGNTAANSSFLTNILLISYIFNFDHYTYENVSI